MKRLVSSLSLMFAVASSAYASNDQICTFDVNAWGNSSVCSCEEGLKYSEVTGQCLTPSAFAGLGRHGENINAACTRDLTEFGNPGNCVCPDELEYDKRSGSCVTDTVPQVVTQTGTLKLVNYDSSYDNDIRFVEAQLITPEGARFELNFNSFHDFMLSLDGSLIRVTGERVYLNNGSLNAPAGTLITVDSVQHIR